MKNMKTRGHDPNQDGYRQTRRLPAPFVRRDMIRVTQMGILVVTLGDFWLLEGLTSQSSFGSASEDG